MGTNDNPVIGLYVILAILVAGTGVGVIVWQTGATRRALATRRGMLAGGVLLVLLGGVVLLTQVVAFVSNSYGTIGTSAG